MTAATRVVQDMDALIASIRLEWTGLAAATLSSSERQELRRHIGRCIAELTKLQVHSRVPANA